MAKPYIRFGFRIYSGDKPFLGPGRIKLMELIQKHGSIAKAADEMSISYRKAWQMVKDGNDISGKPMIDVRLGGKKGGGAVITQYGLEAMEKYYMIQDKAEVFFTRTLKEAGF